MIDVRVMKNEALLDSFMYQLDKFRNYLCMDSNHITYDIVETQSQVIQLHQDEILRRMTAVEAKEKE